MSLFPFKYAAFRPYYRPRSHRVEVAALGTHGLTVTILFTTTTTTIKKSKQRVSNAKIAILSITAYSGTDLRLAQLSQRRKLHLKYSHLKQRKLHRISKE
ncbi:hypothetical protein V1478_009409 [Vespula squamosa]|uniref:Uncharacterized protein n=1 Tax=Vespula squamosa TaxID=30214 RepID=A0ABD2APJ8_VESSQ